MYILSITNLHSEETMNFDQLRQLDEVARRGTISAAAKALHITQPALSRSMQRLETDLGHKLFSRVKNHVAPNEAGKIVIDFARVMLREERVLRDSLDGLSLRERTLRIGTVAPVPVWHITKLTVESYPGTVLQPLQRDEEDLADELENRSIDIAVSLAPLDTPHCESFPFMHEELCAYVPREHPLAGPDPIDVVLLDGETFLVDSMAGFWIDRVRKKVPHAKFIEQADRQVLGQMVESTNLLSFMTSVARPHAAQDSDRILVPLTNEDLMVTFYLNALEDAPARVRQIMDCVRVQV